MNKIQRFFGRLFATQAYLDSLSDAEIAAGCMKGIHLYKYAYNRGRADAAIEAYHKGRVDLVREMAQKASLVSPKVEEIHDPETGEYLYTSYSWT